MSQQISFIRYTPAQQHRLAHVLDLFDGFSDGLDYDRLAAGIAFARAGAAKPYPDDLIDLFAAFYLGAEEVGEWERTSEDHHRIEAVADLDRIIEEAATLDEQERDTRSREETAYRNDPARRNEQTPEEEAFESYCTANRGGAVETMGFDEWRASRLNPLNLVQQAD